MSHIYSFLLQVCYVAVVSSLSSHFRDEHIDFKTNITLNLTSGNDHRDLQFHPRSVDRVNDRDSNELYRIELER